MISFNRTLHPNDYAIGGMGLWLYMFDLCVESRVIPYMPNPHLHRRWEYGMAMEFLASLGGPDKVKSVLDVGGAGSLFAPIALSVGYNVTVVDLDPCVYMLAGQARNVMSPGAGEAQAVYADFMEWGITRENGKYSVEVYDAVISISTIEHVPEDVAFIEKLAKHAELGIFLTTDFSMDGGQYAEGHLRTYTPKTLKNKLDLGSEWQYAGEPEWKDNGQWVNGYSFASLGVIQNEKI